MSFAKGEVVCGRSFDSITGKEHIMFSYPDGWTLEDAKKQLAPDLDLKGFQETTRSQQGKSLFDRMAGAEVREIVTFTRTTN